MSSFCCRLVILAIALFAVGTSTLSAAQTAASGEYAISGTVVDPLGGAVSGARVSLAQQPSSALVEITTTDTSGHFSFRGVRSGQYSLVVSVNGFQSLTRPIDAAQDGNKDLTLTLDVAAVFESVSVQGQTGRVVTSTGSLTPVRLMDLPQSVQIASRELLDEQQAFQYADAATYLTGVQRAYHRISGATGNMVAMRGFVLDTSNGYQRDGYKFFGVGRSDTADIEEVQVLKGPASALYGAAEPGGVVNLITKKPTSTPFASVSMTGGSFGFLRPEFDVSGPIASKTLFYRLNGVYENTDSFRDYIHSEKSFLAPQVLWKPNAFTSLAVLGEFIHADRVDDYGVPMFGDRPAPVPISTQYVEPWSTEKDRDWQFGYRFNHLFASGWNLYNGFHLARTNATYTDAAAYGPNSTDPTLVTRYSSADLAFPNIYRYSQTSLSGNVKTGGATHHIAVGFEAGWVTASSLGPIGYAPDISVLNPQLGNFSLSDALSALKNPYFVLDGTTYVHNQAFYAQDQVDLSSHWKAIAGIRLERYFQDSVNNASDTHQTQTNFPVSPRVGLVYQSRDWLSIYGSYVKSFVPPDPSALNFEGRQFDPGKTHQWEGGVKAASPSGRVSSTLALYQIEKNNVVAPDPNNPLFSVQNGQERSKGIELEFQGSPIPGLNLLTSYAYTLARVSRSTQYPVGNILPNAPRNSGAIWASYQAPSGMLRNVGLNAGVMVVGDRQDTYYNTGLLPGYSRLDLGAFYDLSVGNGQKFRVSANVQNVLDRVYYLASNGQNQVRPGSPVAALVSLRWTRQ